MILGVGADRPQCQNTIDTRYTIHAPTEAHHTNNHFTEICSGSEVGSYLRFIDSCITQLKAQGPCRTWNESKEEEEEDVGSYFGYNEPVLCTANGIFKCFTPAPLAGFRRGQVQIRAPAKDDLVQV